MRAWTFLAIAMLVALSGGCAPSFTGQWLEEGVAGRDGVRASVTGLKRMALDFGPIAEVRYGTFDERAGVVDAASLQSAPYYKFAGGKIAQFGAMTARLEGRQHMIVTVGDVQMRFNRHRGRSIFPPLITPPVAAADDHDSFMVARDWLK
ncbi:hypothetical protein [Fontivita pretiosa]|uniref:hypothetical protein n=1 Tax=Fontivita pretiosa TaxID=2989684 RepID=UPI003D18682C